MAGDKRATTSNGRAAENARAAENTRTAESKRATDSTRTAESKRAYADKLIARARQLSTSDAFAAPDAQEVSAHARSYEATRKHRAFSKRRMRQTIFLGVVLVVAVCAMSLCLPYYGVNTMGAASNIYAPSDVIDAYALWFQLNVMPLFDSTITTRAAAMLNGFNETHPDVVYQLVVQRGAVTLVVIACGVLLAVSGMLFQTSFRNPLATPTMLGVSDGVTLGCIIFALLGYAQAADNMALYLMLVYGCGAAAVVAVILLSRAISGRHFNVFDMLLLGTVACQLLGGINSYITNFGMDISTWENFYNLQQAGDVLSYPQTWIVVAVVFFVTIIPVVVLRFRLNLVSFDDADMRLMGARPTALRGLALILGSVMQLAALASVGQVAMLSLAVPFLVRYLMPSDFRYQLLGNCLLGILILLVCVAFQHFATIGVVTVPVGTLVSVLVVPFFVWVIALHFGRQGD